MRLERINRGAGVGAAWPHVNGVGSGAASVQGGVSAPEVASHNGTMRRRSQGSVDLERAVHAAMKAGRATADTHPENFENALVDFLAGFSLAYGSPHIEDRASAILGVSPGLSQETYAELGVLLGDLFYDRYVRN